MLAATIWPGIMAKAQPSRDAAVPRPFEVASIKPNRSGGAMNKFHPYPGGFTATNCSVGVLMQYAFDAFQFQVSGAPEWVKSDGYDIAAKAEGISQLREIRAMVGRLLEDRFQLKYHWGTKEGAVYQLVVSKAGKVKQSGQEACPSIMSPADAKCGLQWNAPGYIQGKMTLGELAGVLSSTVKRPVLDKTALTSRYDIELHFTPESIQTQSSTSSGRDWPSISQPSRSS